MLAAWFSSATFHSTAFAFFNSDSYSCTSTPFTLCGASPLPSFMNTRCFSVVNVGISGSRIAHNDVSQKIT